MKQNLPIYFSLLILLLISQNKSNVLNGLTSFDCGNIAQIPESECEALIAIYNSTDGDNWRYKEEWLMHNAPCYWEGVGCEDGHVVWLDFTRYVWYAPKAFGLNGPIPPEIGNLSYLRTLNLEENNITSIPPQISGLQNLTALILQSTGITDLPSEIGQLDNLLIFDLSNNELELDDIPPEIGGLNRLEELDLSINSLDALPTEIGNLNSLRELTLSGNDIKSIPSEIGELHNLAYLNLDLNELNSLPPEIGNLVNLKLLSLEYNRLNSLPLEIGNLVNLETLSLEHNLLSSLPATVGNLTNLPTLNLSDNQLTSLPSEIGNLNTLAELDLSNNRINALPATIGNLTDLHYLYLSNNSLTSLPPEIANLDNLWHLYADHNQLQELPSEIGGLENLSNLRLSFNQLSSLPPEIGLLTSLSWIVLDHNQFSGDFPIEVTNIPNLRYLYINYNPLVGLLPQNLTTMMLLQRFHFDNTDLCEPTDLAFQAWLSDIESLRSSGFTCVSETITPAGGALQSVDNDVTFAFPENTFTETVTVTYRPLAVTLPEIQYPLTLVQGYELIAESTNTGQIMYPSGTFSTTIRYQSEPMPIKEETINLYYWDNTQWVLEPSALVDTNTNTITATPDYFSYWAVLGESEKQYFPQMFTNHYR